MKGVNCAIRLAIIAVITAMVMLCGCTTVRYVPLETGHWRTEMRERTDTLILRDSVRVESMGETIREVRYKTAYKVRTLRDTVVQRDTITRVQERIVEAHLGVWERIKINYGGWAIGMLAIIIVYLSWRILRR